MNRASWLQRALAAVATCTIAPLRSLPTSRFARLIVDDAPALETILGKTAAFVHPAARLSHVVFEDPRAAVFAARIFAQGFVR